MNPLFPFNGTAHLLESQLLPSASSCPLCGSSERSVVHPIQEAPAVTLLQCHRCGGASVSRMPTEEALDALYADFYKGASHQDDAPHVTFGNLNRFGAHLARAFGAVSPGAPLRILDFGGGDGSIALNVAEKLRAQGAGEITVQLVDYGDAALPPYGEGIVFQQAGNLDALGDNEYDFIIASGVIEHVPDPRETLEALFARLATQGRFYARTPHVVPYMRCCRKGTAGWFFPYPAHLHDMGARCWENLVERAGKAHNVTRYAARPAIVQVSFAQNWRVALLSHLAKAPWYLLGNRYPFVGGWEVVVRKDGADLSDRPKKRATT